VAFPVLLSHLYAAGVSPERAKVYLMPLNAAMSEFLIDRFERPAMFLAQVAHESGAFRYVEEIWGPTPAQLNYPDGREWSGHGLIQITHRYNHEAEAKFFGLPMSRIVDWLKSPEGACRSAAHYWNAHGCNALSDAFDFVGITRKINGNVAVPNGLADRASLYAKIAEAMNGR
jgi:putative chitinase